MNVTSTSLYWHTGLAGSIREQKKNKTADHLVKIVCNGVLVVDPFRKYGNLLNVIVSIISRIASKHPTEAGVDCYALK